jgi:hypothetical protein
MKKTVFMFAMSMMLTLSVVAQQPGYVSDGALLDGKTIVKANLTGIALNTYGFSAERILTKNISLSVGVGVMPAGPFPYIEKIADLADLEEDVRGPLLAGRINTFSFTPEVRIYTGGGYGKGFYLSPYYKYEKFGLDNFAFDIEVEGGEEENITIKGNIDTHAFGLAIGYQWLLGKNRNIIIDWTILGGHYGTSSGLFNGKFAGEPITGEYREKVEEEFNNILSDLPIIKAEATINNDNTADVTVKGPWAFLRGGVSVGFRF